MKKTNLYKVLGIICFIVWIITTILQVIYPHPFRGLIGNIVLVIGLLLLNIHDRINQIKTPLYDPDKTKHFRNWLVFILINVLLVIMIGIFCLKII